MRRREAGDKCQYHSKVGPDEATPFLLRFLITWIILILWEVLLGTSTMVSEQAVTVNCLLSDVPWAVARVTAGTLNKLRSWKDCNAGIWRLRCFSKRAGLTSMTGGCQMVQDLSSLSIMSPQRYLPLTDSAQGRSEAGLGMSWR